MDLLPPEMRREISSKLDLGDIEALKEADPTFEWDIPRYHITSVPIQEPFDFNNGSVVNLPWKPKKIEIQILEEPGRTIPASEIGAMFDQGKVIISRVPGAYNVNVRARLEIGEKTPLEKNTTPPGIKIMRLCIRGPYARADKAAKVIVTF